MVKKYGTRSSIVRVLDNVPLFNPIRHINDPKREILHLYIPKNSKQPPYSSEEILQCQLFDLEVDDEAYTVGRGGANGNEDLLHGSSGGNHRGRPSSPVARRANNYLDVDDLSDSDGDNLYSDEEEKMTEEQKEEWRRVQMEKERRREERKGMQKRALEHMRMEGHRRMIAEEQHRARYGENTFFTSLVNPHARIQPPAIEVIRRESCCSSSTNTTATGDGNESKRRNQPALLLDDSMFDKESTVRTHVNPDSPSRRKQVRVDTPSIVGLDQYPAYSSSTDEDLDEVTVRKLSPVQEPEQHTFVCDPAKLPLIVKFIISSSYLLQVWMNSSGILISTLRKLSVLFTPNEVSLFNGHLPSDLHLQLIRKGCQVELIDGEHSISVPLTANSSAFSFSHYVQMLVSAAKLARFTNSPQSLSSLHEHFGLPEVSELLADDSIEKELSTLMQLQDVRIDDNGHIQIDNP
ncbi:hypothetical protein WR25_02196 [Diploscapter pachys]|uniref:Uncharacterized protein n=1 Tax=Diploscapter pachys TaxID=2018661 RepID=A0A2A2J9J0_9BILA|nr:hypothetical protein WR25_02196 [Diploscapter pachys]